MPTGGCLDCRKSTTDYAYIISGACWARNSEKQATVVFSTTEVGYMAISAACQELKWLLNFLARDRLQDTSSVLRSGVVSLSIATVGSLDFDWRSIEEDSFFQNLLLCL